MAYKHATKLVFNKPKMYKAPSVNGGLGNKLAFLTPSKWDMMREELGLSDDDLLNSDSDKSGDENETNDGRGGVSREKVEVLRRELEQKDRQREDLILQVKTFRDNAKKYRARCEKDQASKWQQIKIMRKTHESHLEEKRQLISNLQDIIEEQESRIYELENKITGSHNYSPNSSTSSLSEHVHKLASSLDRLQTEMASIREKQLDAEHQLVAMEQDHDSEKQGIQGDMAQLRTELSSAQDMIQTLQNGDVTHTSSGTDNEKEIALLKEELQRYEDELHRAKAIHERGVEEHEESSQRDASIIKRFELENSRLKDRILELEADVATKSKIIAETEASNKKQQHRLERAIKDQAGRLKAVEMEFADLKAHPQMVEVVKTVTVESEGVKDALAAAQDTNTQLRQQVETLKQSERALAVAKKTNVHLRQKVSSLKETEHALVAAQDSNAELREEIVALQESERSLIAARESNTHIRRQMSTLKESYQATEQQLKHSRTHVQALQERLREQESQMAVLDREFQAIMERSKAEVAEARSQSEETNKHLKQRFSTLQSRFSQIRPGLLTIAAEYQQLRSLCSQFPSMLQTAIAQAKEEIGKALSDITEHNRILVQKYLKEMSLRKKYLNEIIDLKGSIRVFCRIRPVITEDGVGPLVKNAVNLDPDDDALVYLQNKGRSTMFEVDRVFAAQSTQEQVFQEVEPLIVSSIDGYNVCIFAYGQTGSGKTYTMEGPSSNPGINQRALQLLFEETARRVEEWEYVITVSVMEIYNEQLRDLLSDDPQFKLEIKMNPDGSGLYVPGLCEVDVSSVENVNEVFSLGKRNRATATTDMNEHSSRSHALLCVKIVGTNKTSGKRYIGKLNLVDLAGSERVNKSGSSTDSARMKEAQSINKSLSSLGDVIFALRTKQAHIPYRNSKLTYLLQESLGGDSKTLMVVQISPVSKNVSESQCSLSFAQRVRAVELGAASKRAETAEMAVLKDRLAQYEDGPSSGYHSSPTRSNKGTPTRSQRGTPRR